MRVIRLLVLALVLLLPVAQAPHGLAQEATPGASPTAGGSPIAGWPQFRANPEHTGTALGPGPGDAPVVRWRVENGGGLASPAVANGVVYAGGNGNYVFALDAQTGAERWRFPAASRVPSPAVSGDLVMVGSFSGLYALDAATGAERWSYHGEDGLANFGWGAPVIVGDVVYAAQQFDDAQGDLFAFDAATGKVRWQYDTAQRIGVTPAVADGLVYIATDQVYGGGDAPSAVIAVDAATGAERWRHETGVEGDTFFSSPTIVDGVLYIGSQSEVGPSALHALDAATGEGIWRWDVSQYMTVFSSPAVVDGAVYVGGDGLYAVDAATGAPKWRLGIGDVWSSPAVVDGVVYVISDEGFLVGVDAGTGEMLWHVEVGAGFFATSSPAVADGMVYVNGQDGFFYAIGDGPAAATPAPAAAEATPAGAAPTVLIDRIVDASLLPPAPAYAVLVRTTWPVGSSFERVVTFPGVQIACVQSGQLAFTNITDDGSATPTAGATPEPIAVLNPGECVMLPLDVPLDQRNTGDTPAEVLELVIVPEDNPGPEGRDPAIREDFIAYIDTQPISEVLPGPVHVTVQQTDLAPGATFGPYTGEAPGAIAAVDTIDSHLVTLPDGSVRNIANEPLPIYQLTIAATGDAADATPQVDAATAPADEAAATPVAGAAPEAATELWQTNGGPAPLDEAAYVAVAPDGKVWVAEGGADRFQIFSPAGDYLESWGVSGSKDGEFDFTRANGDAFGGIAFDAAGNIFVADVGNRRIQKFDADRTFVTAWGGFGTGDGEFVDPIYVEVDDDGNVYVADDRRDDIQKFDNDGAYLATLSGHGSEPGQISFTGAFDIDADGAIYVADFGNNRVQKLGPDGAPLLVWDETSSGTGQFADVNGVAVGDDGLIYVADTGNQRIQVFTSDGQFLGAWGSAGDGPGQFGFPIIVALDGAGNAYVADIGLGRIQKFQLNPLPADATPEATPAG